MINIIDKVNCCGCSACASACPKRCITMKSDNEGFLYPHLDKPASIAVSVRRYAMSFIHFLREVPFKFGQPLIKMKRSA